MEKKLYCVKVVLYVMAENTSGACAAATQAPFDIFECTARRADHLADGWADAVPYNADDERTCSEILASQQPVPATVPFQLLDNRQRPAFRPPLNAATADAPASVY